jgi:AraC-like DNA-binding protein
MQVIDTPHPNPGHPGHVGSASQVLARAWQRASARRNLFSTTDPDCAQAIVGRMFRPHRLEPASGARLNARMDYIGSGLLGVSCLHYGGAVDILPGPLERFYLLQIPIAGAARIETGGQVFMSDPGCASLISPTPDLRMHWGTGNVQLCVRLEAEALRRFISAWCGWEVRRMPVFLPQVALDARPQLLDLLLTLLQVAGHGEVDPLPSSQLQYRLLTMLLGSLPNDCGGLLAGESPPIAPRSVRVVEDFLVAHCAEPLTPESLAAVAGVSVRSMFLGFQRYRGVSPMRLLREVRLRRVRESLVQATPGTRVTEVALHWGFCHMGRFGQEYALAFGESPSQTLKATTGH